ncbi:MAG: ATPase domain-containing protein [archaeon]
MPLEDIPRTKTGIQGLDAALNGGIPTGNAVLISGGAGTGKSTFCLQFAVNGATLFGEKTLYISTEQTREELYRQAYGFNWRVDDLEARNLLKIVFFDVTNGNSFMEKLDAIIMDFKPRRIIIDSLTTLTDSLLVSGMTEDKGFSMVQIAETVNPMPRTDQIMTKHILYTLFKAIKKYKVTSVFTSELPEDEHSLSADGVSEFVADGVLMLHFLGMGGVDSRSMRVRKMRYTDHFKDIMQYEMNQNGFVVYADSDIKV